MILYMNNQNFKNDKFQNVILKTYPKWIKHGKMIENKISNNPILINNGQC